MLKDNVGLTDLNMGRCWQYMSGLKQIIDFHVEDTQIDID